MTIAVRLAERADDAFVEELAERTVMDSVPAFRHPAQVQVRFAIARLLGIVERQSHVTLIAHDGERRVGFAMLVDDLPDEVTSTPQAFIAYMAVEPEYHRRGVGTALLHAAETESRRRGLPYIALMVTEDNHAARALYERCGYVTERRLLCKAL